MTTPSETIGTWGTLYVSLSSIDLGNGQISYSTAILSAVTTNQLQSGSSNIIFQPYTGSITLPGSASSSSIATQFPDSVAPGSSQTSVMSNASTLLSSAATPPTYSDTLIAPWTTTLTQNATSDQTLAGQVTWIPSDQDTTALAQSDVVAAPWTTVLTQNATSGQVLDGRVTLVSSSNSTDIKFTNTENTKGLGPGPAAGLAVGMLIAGLIIAAVVLTMWQKKKSSKRRPRKDHGFATYNSTRYEKSGANVAVLGSGSGDFDLDRLFPQPFDDTTVKREVENFFSQINGHVDNFYTDEPKNAGRQTNDQSLLNPLTRSFRIKQLVCQTMLESVGLDCPSDRSLLPHGLTSMARRLKDQNLNDHATTLSWSRFRTSVAYLLRPDSATERARLDQITSTIVQHLNQQIQPFEVTGSTSDRAQDLRDICQASAALGQMLLSQPAVWRFDWNAQARHATSGPGLVYNPALVRLTDNKARKLLTPSPTVQAKAMQ